MAVEIEQSAFVLHQRPYRETSLLVTFFTPDYGKQNAVVKGVRSASKSARAKQAWLQPFQGLSIRWLEKSVAGSHLVSLRHFEPGEVRFPLFGEANLCGLYVNELLYRLLYPSLAVGQVFHQYQQALYGLAKAQNRAEQAWVLRQFEFGLLTELGFGFDLSCNHQGEPIEAEKEYEFFAELGFFEWRGHSEQVSGVRVSGHCLQQFQDGVFCEACLPQLKSLFQTFLAPYLGQQPIQARRLFQASVEDKTLS